MCLCVCVRECILFWDWFSRFNWRQRPNVRDTWETLRQLIIVLQSPSRFSCVNTKTSPHVFVWMRLFQYVCFFVLHKHESDTEFMWKHTRACVYACMCTHVLISECFKCYPVPVELFIISICVRVYVCVSVYTIACVWCVFTRGVTSPWPVFFLHFL